jgi:tetratricopeptide (TPR) repeat protein
MRKRITTTTLAVLSVAIAGLAARTAVPAEAPRKPVQHKAVGTTAAASSPLAREAAWRENNLGVAFLEQYDNKSAVEAFRRALEKDPTLDVVRVNLAIALFYMPDVAGAHAAASEALAKLPEAPQLHYLLGLIARFEDEPAEAEARLRKVLAIDPGDFGANLLLGQVLVDRERHLDALPLLERAAVIEPWNASVAYSRAMALGRGGKREESQVAMRRFQELRNNPAHTTFGKIYLEQGRYAEAIASSGAEPGLVDRRTPRVVFAENAGAVPSRAAASAATLALADLDGDGRLDVIEASGGALRLLRNDGGRFVDVTATSGVSGPALAAVAGDYDNDGRPDLLLVRPSGLALFHHDDGLRFSDVTGKAEIPALAGLPATAAFADVDHDGDLDVALPGLLLQNDGDGTFTDVTGKAKLVLDGGGLAVVPTDYDNGRDLDLVVLRAAGRPLVFANRRDGRFEDVAAAVGLEAEGPFRALAAADWNKDSYPDFFLGAERTSSTFALSDGRGRFALKPGPAGLSGVRAAQAIDYDNDGLLDLLALTVRGPRLFRNLGDGWADVSSSALPQALRASAEDGAALAIADLDGDGDPDVLVATASGTRLWTNEGGNAKRSFAVKLEGRISNKGAVGAKIDLRAGSLREKIETSAAVPMVAPADVLFGLGARKAPDTVRVIWVSGVVQTETEFPNATTEATRTAVSLVELDRKPSSCPYLYAWNGERFEFVTDFLGAGEMGYWEAPGERSHPDPVEYVRIGPGQLRAKGGRYELRVNNELEEVLYLDKVRLLAIDHPRGVEVYPDEGMTQHPKRFRVLAVADARTPHVTDASGADAMERARAVDRSFVEGFGFERVRGYAKEHAVTLDLASLPVTHRTLLLTGWTDYAFSSDNVAASQMGLALVAPRLEVETAPGTWQTAIEDLGVPVGRPQTIVADLGGLRLGPTARVRIVTSMRVYWDRIAVGQRVEEALRPIALAAKTASLRERGFSAGVAAGAFEAYDFEYARVSATSPWKTMPGRYTREGDVRELLAATDDRFVVSKPGDEIALSFPSLPAPRSGRERTFLLMGDGFSKEMDINSASPDIVLPLPYHGMKAYPYAMAEAPAHVRRLAEQSQGWNTRVVARPLPALELAAGAQVGGPAPGR